MEAPSITAGYTLFLSNSISILFVVEEETQEQVLC